VDAAAGQDPGGGGAVLSGVEVAGAAIISAVASTSASSNPPTDEGFAEAPVSGQADVDPPRRPHTAKLRRAE
jgi:hypothetical protein